MDPYGLGRVVSPRGVLPQRADVLDPSLPAREDELAIDVERLHVDAASLRQLEIASAGDDARLAADVAAIVAARGKMHNPVTGSGGILVGRVREIGPRHPAAGELAPGERIATLVSLTLTPLRLERLHGIVRATGEIECEGTAILFATGLWARLPDDLPEPVALAALDVCGAPALVARHVRAGQRVLVLGAGKAGALVCAQARDAGAAVVAADRSDAALAAVAGAALCDAAIAVDATDAIGTLQRAGAAFDVVVNCASLPGTEMASVLCAAPGGTVLFFSMATSFTAAALGAEGVGKDALLVIGNGYVPGHAELTLGLLRRHGGLRRLFEERFARGR